MTDIAFGEVKAKTVASEIPVSADSHVPEDVEAAQTDESK
jgi:hypothetical protein